MPMARKSNRAWPLAAALLAGTAAALTAQQLPSNTSQPSSSNSSLTPSPTVRNPQNATASGNLHNSSLSAIPEDFEYLKLAPGFLVTLDVLDDPDFQGNYRVDQDGNLGLPVIGNVHVAGETASEAQAQIQKRLLDGQILNNPEVNLATEYAGAVCDDPGEVVARKISPHRPHRLTGCWRWPGALLLAAGNEIEITHAGAATAPTSWCVTPKPPAPAPMPM